MKITDCCFSLLIHHGLYFPAAKNFLLTPLKQKFYISNKVFINLLCDIVVYKVQKSKHDLNAALLRLLKLLIELFVTGRLFKIFQKDFTPEKEVLCLR